MSEPWPQHQQSLQYLTSQLTKLTVAQQHQQLQLDQLTALQQSLEKVSSKIREVEKKMRVIEVYQNENLEEGKRLHLKFITVEMMEQKVKAIEQEMQEDRESREKRQKKDREEMEQLGGKVKEI